MAEAEQFYNDLKQLNALGMPAAETAGILTGGEQVDIMGKQMTAPSSADTTAETTGTTTKKPKKAKDTTPVKTASEAGVQKTNSAGLNLPGGRKDDNVYRILPNAMSNRQKEVNDWLTARGYKNVYIVNGAMHDDIGNIIRAHIRGDSIWVRADDPGASLWALARHEDGHRTLDKLRATLEGGLNYGGEQETQSGQVLSGGGPATVDAGGTERSSGRRGTSASGAWSQEIDARLASFLRANLGDEQYLATYKAYNDKYAEVLKGKSSEQKKAVINEEIFADALGKIDSYGVNASELHDAAVQLLTNLERRVAFIALAQQATTAAKTGEGKYSMADESPNNAPAPVFYSKLEGVG